MFATTQPEDIPQTVRSRCQHFSFHAVKLDDILKQLRMVVEKENLVADEGALSLLAEAGDGSMRDALSIMDQAIASAPVNQGTNFILAGNSPDHASSPMGTVSNSRSSKRSSKPSAPTTPPASSSPPTNSSTPAALPAQLARQFVRYLRNCCVVAPRSPASLQRMMRRNCSRSLPTNAVAPPALPCSSPKKS